MSDQYAVMGNPVSHSLSPRIHQWFALQTGQDLQYSAQHVGLDDFETAVISFFNEGGKGLNITVPFKERAWQMSQVKSKRAAVAGAVNTLLVGKDGKVYGDNTDGVGLVKDLRCNNSCRIQGMRLLVLGAGGTVRGILKPLLDEKPASLTIANRTREKAEKLAQDFASLGSITALGYQQLEGLAFDAIINATSASLQGKLPPLPDNLIKPDGWTYDMMYGAEETLFNQWAAQQGVTRRYDGLGMLVEQAAEAFYIWRHVRPETTELIAQLKAERS